MDLFGEDKIYEHVPVKATKHVNKLAAFGSREYTPEEVPTVHVKQEHDGTWTVQGDLHGTTIVMKGRTKPEATKKYQELFERYTIGTSHVSEPEFT